MGRMMTGLVLFFASLAVARTEKSSAEFCVGKAGEN
jgi:hypothetical protein